MVREKGEGEDWDSLGEWDLGGREYEHWSREIYILTKGAIFGFARDLSLEGFLGPRRGPRIVSLSAEDRVPEMALAH